MPGTHTPEQSLTIKYLAKRANILADLLGGKDIHSGVEHQNILLACSIVANELAQELALLTGGAA